jgi:hypothetical protein
MFTYDFYKSKSFQGTRPQAGNCCWRINFLSGTLKITSFLTFPSFFKIRIRGFHNFRPLFIYKMAFETEKFAKFEFSMQKRPIVQRFSDLYVSGTKERSEKKPVGCRLQGCRGKTLFSLNKDDATTTNFISSLVLKNDSNPIVSSQSLALTRLRKPTERDCPLSCSISVQRKRLF